MSQNNIPEIETTAEDYWYVRCQELQAENRSLIAERDRAQKTADFNRDTYTLVRENSERKEKVIRKATWIRSLLFLHCILVSVVAFLTGSPGFTFIKAVGLVFFSILEGSLFFGVALILLSHDKDCLSMRWVIISFLITTAIIWIHATFPNPY